MKEREKQLAKKEQSKELVPGPPDGAVLSCRGCLLAEAGGGVPFDHQSPAGELEGTVWVDSGTCPALSTQVALGREMGLEGGDVHGSHSRALAGSWRS